MIHHVHFPLAPLMPAPRPLFPAGPIQKHDINDSMRSTVQPRYGGAGWLIGYLSGYLRGRRGAVRCGDADADADCIMLYHIVLYYIKINKLPSTPDKPPICYPIARVYRSVCMFAEIESNPGTGD